MTTQSLSSSTVRAARWITEALHQSLETSLTKRCSERHNTEIALRRLDDSEEESTMHVQLECPLIQIPVRFTVNHVGGNVYDVHCAIEGGPSCRFSYSLPTSTGTALSQTPCLGQEFADFLLDELEQQLGRRLLCGPTPTSA